MDDQRTNNLDIRELFSSTPDENYLQDDGLGNIASLKASLVKYSDGGIARQPSASRSEMPMPERKLTEHFSAETVQPKVVNDLAEGKPL